MDVLRGFRRWVFVGSLAASTALAWQDPSQIEKPQPVTSPLDAMDVQVEGPAKVQKDLPIDYKVVVTNKGDKDVDNIVIEAVLTEQFRVTSSEPSAEQIGDRLIWKLAEMKAGETKHLAFRATAQAAGAGRVRAFARLDRPEPAHPEPPRLPDPLPTKGGLAIRLDGPDQVIVGEPFQCDAVVLNQSGKVIENGGFALNLTTGLKLREAPKAASGPFRLESGGSLRVPISLVAESSGVQGVRAQVEADGGVKTTAEREIRAEQADFAVHIELAKEQLVGQPLKIRIYVANRKPTPASNVQIAINVPENVEIISGEAGALFNRTTRSIRWQVAEIPANEERGFRLTLRPMAAGILDFNVSAQSAAGVASRDAKQIKVEAHAALGVTVEPSADVVVGNELLSIAFDVRSRGTQKAGGVVLRLDKLPAFMLETDRSPDWQEADGAWRYLAPRDIAPGESLRSILVLRAADPGNHLLKATIVSNDIVGEIIRTQPVRVLAPPPPIPNESAAPKAD